MQLVMKLQTKYKKCQIIYINNMKLTHSNSKKVNILNGVKYIPYEVCELPKNFGFHDREPVVGMRSKEAITKWFNYKGLTYVAE